MMADSMKLGDAQSREISLPAIERLLAHAQLKGKHSDRSPGLSLTQCIRDLLVGEVLLSREFLSLSNMTDSKTLTSAWIREQSECQ